MFFYLLCAIVVVLFVFRLWPSLIVALRVSRTSEEFESLQTLHVRIYEDIGLTAIYVANVTAGIIVALNAGVFTAPTWAEMFRADVAAGSQIYMYFRWQIALYSALLLVVVVPPQKKDVRVMVAHHALTTVALSICYLSDIYIRGMLVVLLLHDLCDVPLHLSYVANRFESRVRYFTFPLFTAAHFLLRVVLFPIVAVYAVLLETSIETTWTHWLPLAICGLIWGMHVFWLLLAIRSCKVALCGTAIDNCGDCIPVPTKVRTVKHINELYVGGVASRVKRRRRTITRTPTKK